MKWENSEYIYIFTNLSLHWARGNPYRLLCLSIRQSIGMSVPDSCYYIKTSEHLSLIGVFVSDPRVFNKTYFTIYFIIV